MATRQKTDEKIQYFVKRSSEKDIILEIPASWKITFGYVNPAQSGDAYRNREGHCLRVYEAEKLRGVWANVVELRDMSIPMAAKNEKEIGSASWEQDSEGNFERSEKRQIETSFAEAEVFEFDEDK